MASFTVTWSSGGGVYKQELFLKPKYSGSWSMVASLNGTVNTYTLQGLQENIIYLFKVKSYCNTGTPSELSPIEFIKFSCPTLTATGACGGVINFSFPQSGGDVDLYDVVLYNSLGVQLSTQSVSPAATITGSFTGLSASTTYKLRVVPKADTHLKSDCTQVSTTTLPPAPTVTTHPQSIAVCDDGPNSTITLTAGFNNGTTYSWYRNGVLITNGGNYSGATTTSLTISNAGSILGTFTCKTVNVCGEVTTNGAVITPLADTSISTQPSVIPTCVTDPVTLSVTAGGVSLTYQWEKSTDGGSAYSDISGATSSTYTVAAGTAVDGDRYRVKVNSTCGPLITSSAAVVDTVVTPVIDTHPVNQEACAGVNVTFTVAYTAEDPTVTIWQQYVAGIWTDISGATTISYTTNVLGTYRFKVANACGTVYSNSATLTEGQLSITSHPSSQTICENGTATFTVAASGAGLSFQWQQLISGTWTNISGATSATLTLTSVPLSSNGKQYRASVTGDCGTVISSPATLTVNDSSPIWVNRDISLHWVCVGVDKHYQQIDTNTCSVTYNQTQTGSLYEANSVDCGYDPPSCNPPAVQSASITYIDPCNCPPGYVASPDLSECVQEIETAATPPTASTFDRTLVAKTLGAYTSFQTAVLTGGFDPATGVPTGGVVTNTSAWWKNTTGNLVDGPMNRCAVWTNLTASNQRIGFSICLNTTQDKTYLVGVGCDNFASIKVNGTTVLTQSPSALGQYWAANPSNLTQPFNVWHIYPIFIPAGNNVIEVSGNNVSSVAAVGVEIYDGTAAQILAAQSYAELGQRLVFSTKDIVGTQVLSGTDGVGYTCPDNTYVIKSCGLTTPVCYKVTTTTCSAALP